MVSFLQQAAEHIFKRHSPETIRNAMVILPSRRAVFFFKKELAACSDVPFISPLVFSVDDFVIRFSGLKNLDAVSLLFELFDVFREIDPATSFDKFIAWAPTLLKDFDSIDQAMVENPYLLFSYMSEAEAISRWNLGEDYEIPEGSRQYFGFFDKLSRAYAGLYQRLLGKGLAYRGMAYRIMAGDIEKMISENTPVEKFYFVGLNALSKAEESIVETLVKAGKAECLWDTDTYYMDGTNKAGKVLRAYRDSGKFGAWNWQDSLLKELPREINIFGLANNVMQAKLASRLLENAPPGNNVIVVLDESLIQPIMLSIPDNIKDYNITMGLPLGNSMIASFLEVLFELQQHRIRDFVKQDMYRYNHRQVFKLINHPVLRILQKDHLDGKLPLEVHLERIRDLILKRNMVYVSAEDLINAGVDSPLIGLALTDWSDEPSRCIQVIHQITGILRDFLRVSDNPMEAEFFFVLARILNRLDDLVAENEMLTIRSLKVLLKELFKQERVPFSGEPVAELQIMSMLETRCLDFDNVFILSLNEGILPSSGKNNSLIPYDAAKYFGLPLYSDQDAVMAYHFFRLMQRARHVSLLYLLPEGEGVGGGKDKSRFIYQVEEELAPANPGIRLQYPLIRFEGEEASEKLIIQVDKNDFVLKQTKEYLENKGLYPSPVNTYLSCPLQFYWKQVGKISETEQVDDILGPDIFGNILHKTLELADIRTLKEGRQTDAAEIRAIISQLDRIIDSVIRENYGGYEINTGLNAILRKIAGKLLRDYFNGRLEGKDLPVKVLAVERKIKAVFSYKKGQYDFEIPVSGFVDKIELSGDALKIIDYKTGRVDRKDIIAGNQPTGDALKNPAKSKFRQLYMYRYILLKNPEMIKEWDLGEYQGAVRLVPQIYSFRNLSERLEFEVKDNDEQYMEELETLFRAITEEMLDPEIPFRQTDDTDVCRFCDYRNICSR